MYRLHLSERTHSPLKARRRCPRRKRIMHHAPVNLHEAARPFRPRTLYTRRAGLASPRREHAEERGMNSVLTSESLMALYKDGGLVEAIVDPPQYRRH
jgi:hypothetical protein